MYLQLGANCLVWFVFHVLRSFYSRSTCLGPWEGEYGKVEMEVEVRGSADGQRVEEHGMGTEFEWY